MMKSNKLRQNYIQSAPDSGRSMVETLAVLAVFAVLTVAGIVGYLYAMNRHLANQVATEMNQVSNSIYLIMNKVWAEDYMLTLGDPYDSKQKLKSLNEATFYYGCGHDSEVEVYCTPNDTGYYLRLEQIPEDLCRPLANMTQNIPMLIEQEINGSSDYVGERCQKGKNNWVVLYFDRIMDGDYDLGESTGMRNPVSYSYSTNWYWYSSSGFYWNVYSSYSNIGTVCDLDNDCAEDEICVQTSANTSNCIIPSCNKNNELCIGAHQIAPDDAEKYCDALNMRMITKQEYQNVKAYYSRPLWLKNGGSTESWYKCCNYSSSIYHNQWGATPVGCVDKDAEIGEPVVCTNHTECNAENNEMCLNTGNNKKICVKVECTQKGDFCVGKENTIYRKDAKYYCELLDKKLATYTQFYRGDITGQGWVNNGTIQVWSKSTVLGQPSHQSWYNNDNSTYYVMCINPDTVITPPTNACDTHTDCDVENNEMCFQRYQARECAKVECVEKDEFCYGSTYVLKKDAEYYCTLFDKVWATKQQFQYSKLTSGYYWVTDKNAYNKNYDTAYPTTSVYVNRDTDTNRPLCVNAGAEIPKPVDLCKPHAESCTDKQLCLQHGQIKKCFDTQCYTRGEFCYSNQTMPASQVEYFCNLYGKIPATLEQFTYSRKVSGTYWVNNGGIKAYYKNGVNGAPAATTPSTNDDSGRRTNALCIDADKIIPKPEGNCSTHEDCGKNYMCMRSPQGSTDCYYAYCNSFSHNGVHNVKQYCYGSVNQGWRTVADAREFCRLKGMVLASKQDFYNSRQSGHFMLSDGKYYKRYWYEGVSASNTTPSYTLCVSSSFSLKPETLCETDADCKTQYPNNSRYWHCSTASSGSKWCKYI